MAILTVGTEDKVVQSVLRGGDHALDNVCDLACTLAIGTVTSYTLGGFIDILLVLAVIVLVIRLVQGRSVV